MPRFSLDSQGGYAKATDPATRPKLMQIPRPPSLAQAPPELRNQMLLGSTRGRRGRIGGPVQPPSPPTILESQGSEEEGKGKPSHAPLLNMHPRQSIELVGRTRTDGRPDDTPARITQATHSSTTAPVAAPAAVATSASAPTSSPTHHPTPGITRSASQRPHERFLGKAGLPPAPDSDTGYIAVSTHPSSYEIIVRLEGVSLNSITLSTRRRRVLHIAADCYADGGESGGGGGHWERRISFGWDADLTAVRAEFDGRFLKVIVPRKEDDGS
jgi:hypothetical protein